MQRGYSVKHIPWISRRVCTRHRRRCLAQNTSQIGASLKKDVRLVACGKRCKNQTRVVLDIIPACGNVKRGGGSESTYAHDVPLKMIVTGHSCVTSTPTTKPTSLADSSGPYMALPTPACDGMMHTCCVARTPIPTHAHSQTTSTRQRDNTH